MRPPPVALATIKNGSQDAVQPRIQIRRWLAKLKAINWPSWNWTGVCEAMWNDGIKCWVLQQINGQWNPWMGGKWNYCNEKNTIIWSIVTDSWSCANAFSIRGLLHLQLLLFHTDSHHECLIYISSGTREVSSWSSCLVDSLFLWERSSDDLIISLSQFHLVG